MITRHTLAVEGRRVHYRRSGDGPAVVLLHGSPDSSAALNRLITSLANTHCVIALDTPGNGYSHPLFGEPDSQAYAQALKKTVDALGLTRFGLYGAHTGAGIAMDFALAHPNRVTALALDGYAIWTNDERADLLEHYLPEFRPDADGAYLAFLWTRLIDQTRFFPWYRRDGAHRLGMPPPPPTLHHRRALDWLAAGDHYRAPYRSAFKRRGEIGPDRVEVPTLIGCAPPDPLSEHLKRLERCSAQVTVGDWADKASAETAVAQFFAEHPGDPAAQAPERAQISGLQEGFAGPHRLFWRGELNGTGRPLVLLHDAGGSHRLFEPALQHIAERRPVIALDLPGHGFSADGGQPPDSLAAWSRAIAEALDDLSLGRPAIAGFHFGGQLATTLQPYRAGLIGALVYEPAEARAHQDRYCPVITPDADGLYLIAAWRRLRRQALIYPWYGDGDAAVLTHPGSLDADMLHRRLLDLLVADHAAVAASRLQHGRDVSRVLTTAGPIDAFWLDWDPLAADTRREALRRTANVGAEHALPAMPSDWSACLSGWAL